MGVLVNLARRLAGIQPGQISFSEIRDLVAKPDALVLEVGANDGTESDRFLEIFPKGRLYAFEPDPRAAARWRENVTDARATLIETAIGSETGTITFHQSDGSVKNGPATGWDLSGSIKSPKHHLKRHPKITFKNTIDVQIQALDDWATNNNIGVIDFLWADVQGAERDLIRGAAETLKRTRYFYTEYDNREMYEGQWNLSQITESLPHHRLLKRWKRDVLFELKN